jgi:hypothetical protein
MALILTALLRCNRDVLAKYLGIAREIPLRPANGS